MPAPLFIGFDIETKPLTHLVDKYAKPFEPFDEAAVKYGNTKDPLKRADLLAQKRSDHDEARIAYHKNLVERAALDPFTGAIICIGILTDSGPQIIAQQSEAHTLREFWQLFIGFEASTFVFWSGCGDAAKKFDIDYIVTRSRILRVPVPRSVRCGRFYDNRIVDLAGEFLLHQRDRYLKLTKAADMLGLYEDHKDIFPKTEADVVQGEDFWLFWEGNAFPQDMANKPTPIEQRAYAVRYLHNDLLHLKYLAPHILG